MHGSGNYGYRPPPVAYPPQPPHPRPRLSSRPGVVSIVILVVGCMIGLGLRLAMGPLGSTSLHLLAANTIPSLALAVFCALQPVAPVRRIVAVAALSISVLISVIAELGPVYFGISDYVVYAAFLSIIVMVPAVLAWVLVRRRSLVTLVVVAISAVVGSVFQLLAHWLMLDAFNSRATPAVLDVVLLVSIAVPAWIAVGIDAVIGPKRNNPVAPTYNSPPPGYGPPFTR
ncbi:hypothetical protein O4220_02125 [Rhodococcus ruber]|uniref:Integral membrane protein n=1 Tax=Rhodococcus ruber TaxID=1830 RepID=A0ABT4M8W2_9NOCA|nr:hypothetical protein [Rhodococcus ruber]MCZ4517293.1 hypothetical protein [Rhodococcus ruber]